MSLYSLEGNGKIFAMHGNGKGQFVVKLPTKRVESLVSDGKGPALQSRKRKSRVMKKWIAFKGEKQRWVELAQEAYDFVKREPANWPQSITLKPILSRDEPQLPRARDPSPAAMRRARS